jgi:hypothetical protein
MVTRSRKRCDPNFSIVARVNPQYAKLRIDLDRTGSPPHLKNQL